VAVDRYKASLILILSLVSWSLITFGTGFCSNFYLLLVSYVRYNAFKKLLDNFKNFMQKIYINFLIKTYYFILLRRVEFFLESPKVFVTLLL
jgi:hypothetical protein